jgi:hypothetical protein
LQPGEVWTATQEPLLQICPKANDGTSDAAARARVAGKAVRPTNRDTMP